MGRTLINSGGNSQWQVTGEGNSHSGPLQTLGQEEPDMPDGWLILGEGLAFTIVTFIFWRFLAIAMPWVNRQLNL